MNAYDEFETQCEGVPLDEIERAWQVSGRDPFADDFAG